MGELTPGTVLQGKYAVEGLMTEGGTSGLYRGHWLEGAAPIAIRQLDADDDGPMVTDDFEQFEREYEILKGLEHPGLARVLDFFEQDGHTYLVEEFVPGATLDDRMHASRKPTVEETVDIIVQVLDILEFLHGHGVIYRDLKPSNLILHPLQSPRGGNHDRTQPSMQCMVRLVDFGTERRWKKSSTSDHVPLGTPGYAPPEQYGSAESDERSDLYSAGVLLHAMLTGQAPDPSRGRVFAPPHRVVPEVPKDLSTIVLQALEPEAERRFQNAVNMRRAIKRAMGRMPRCPRCGYELPEDGGVCARCAKARASAGNRTPYLALALAFFALIIFYLASLFIRTRHLNKLVACKSNLKEIGAAVELYSNQDSAGFPPRLESLTPNFLKVLPTCPEAATDTYTRGYSSSSRPDRYTVTCTGTHHAGMGQGENYPQYSSTRGLISQ